MIESLEYSQLAAKYVKQDFSCAVAFIALTVAIYILLLVFNVILEINRYNMPITFYIIFLPFEGFSLNWLISFVYQVMIIIFNSLLVFPFIALSVVFLNQACLEIDITIHDTQKLNLVLNYADPVALILGQRLIDKKMKKVLNRTLEMLDWHSNIQDLMGPIFLAEFSLISSLFCMCMYVIVSDFFGSFFCLCLMAVWFSLLFIYCWMGTRIYSKAQQLAATIYEVNWDLLTAKQRKDFLLILMNVQNVNHLNGVFNDVSLETFQKVRNLV